MVNHGEQWLILVYILSSKVLMMAHSSARFGISYSAKQLCNYEFPHVLLRDFTMLITTLSGLIYPAPAVVWFLYGTALPGGEQEDGTSYKYNLMDEQLTSPTNSPSGNWFPCRAV